nr:hypothetical protein [Mycoplasmopsis agalactiae]
MEVDTYWEISRVGGTESLFTYSLQFAYDTAFPPKKNLPTDVREEDYRSIYGKFKNRKMKVHFLLMIFQKYQEN